MWLLVIAGLMITFPAIAVILWYIGRPTWILPAVASLLVNSLPFVAAILIVRSMKKRGVETDGH